MVRRNPLEIHAEQHRQTLATLRQSLPQAHRTTPKNHDVALSAAGIRHGRTLQARPLLELFLFSRSQIPRESGRRKHLASGTHPHRHQARVHRPARQKTPTALQSRRLPRRRALCGTWAKTGRFSGGSGIKRLIFAQIRHFSAPF